MDFLLKIKKNIVTLHGIYLNQKTKEKENERVLQVCIGYRLRHHRTWYRGWNHHDDFICRHRGQRKRHHRD